MDQPLHARTVLACVCAAALCGCASPNGERAAPRIFALERMETQQVCVVYNPRVRKPVFLDKYKQALRARGYQVHVLPDFAGRADCPVVSTYSANYTWAADYMNHAEIRVFVNGRNLGAVYYSHQRGQAAESDDVVFDWVDRLYPPAPAGRAS